MRRKFYDLHAAHKSPVAAEALRRIGELYEIEETICGKPPDARREVRQQRARPLIESLREWLESTLSKLMQKSDVASAIRYALGHWSALTRYVEDGRIEIDNNAAYAASRIAEIVINTQVAVFDITAQRGPVAERVVDGRAFRALRQDPVPLPHQQLVERLQHWLGPPLPQRLPLRKVWRLAPRMAQRQF